VSPVLVVFQLFHRGAQFSVMVEERSVSSTYVKVRSCVHFRSYPLAFGSVFVLSMSTSVHEGLTFPTNFYGSWTVGEPLSRGACGEVWTLKSQKVVKNLDCREGWVGKITKRPPSDLKSKKLTLEQTKSDNLMFESYVYQNLSWQQARSPPVRV
jgi:hypothetical protein